MVALFAILGVTLTAVTVAGLVFVARDERAERALEHAAIAAQERTAAHVVRDRGEARASERQRRLDELCQSDPGFETRAQVAELRRAAHKKALSGCTADAGRLRAAALQLEQHVGIAVDMAAAE
jgi:Flp pilus assembly protein TadB